jgi:hypothetical protein
MVTHRVSRPVDTPRTVVPGNVVGESGGEGMIEETIGVIDQLEASNAAEYQRRYARRNKIRYVDDLLNDLEMLNLADESEIPGELHVRVQRFVLEERHPIVQQRPVTEIGISDWMEVLYDVQDALMLPIDDEVD